MGLARGKYIAWVFGAGPQTDAYMAAFRLPDLMNNFLVGGAVSITFVTILNRYRERGEEDEGERLLFTVLNLMVLVLAAASILLMFLAVPFIRWTNPGFPAAQVVLAAHMTRILLPAQIFLFAGSVLGATLLVRKQFLYQAATPILYNIFIIVCGVLLHRRLGRQLARHRSHRGIPLRLARHQCVGRGTGTDSFSLDRSIFTIPASACGCS